MPKGIYDRATARARRRLLTGTTNLVVVRGARLFWTKEEAEQISSKWIELRLADPVESATVLLERAQRILPGERQRDIASFKNIKQIVAETGRQWKTICERAQAAALPPPAAPAPQVQIVPVEIPRKLTFDEMLAKMDEPALAALLTAKKVAREIRHQELLYANAVQNGASNLPKVPQFIPKLDAFEAPKLHGPRIAVVGNSASHRSALEADVKTHALDVVLRFPDPSDSTAMSRCDFAIVCRGKTNGTASNSDGDKSIGLLGRNHVVLLDEPTTENIMQEIRNLCSRKS